MSNPGGRWSILIRAGRTPAEGRITMNNNPDGREWHRRGFMQSAIYGAGLAAIFPAHFANIGGPEFQTSGEAQKSCLWESLIFAKFDNDALAAALEKCAKRIGCSVFWGEDPSDIIAIPFLVGVIDRRSLGEGAWQSYLEYLEEVFDEKLIIDDGKIIEPKKESPLILIDGDKSFPEPNEIILNRSSVRFYHNSPDNILEITRLIETEHKKIQAAKQVKR